MVSLTVKNVDPQFRGHHVITSFNLVLIRHTWIYKTNTPVINRGVLVNKPVTVLSWNIMITMIQDMPDGLFEKLDQMRHTKGEAA